MSGVRDSLTEPLPRGFPAVVLDQRWGQWWRIHGAEHGPWWFSSSDTPEREPSSIGRFDLPHPNGTCYTAAFLASGAAESLRESGVDHAQAQESADARRLSQMPLDRWYGKPIADFTSWAVGVYGAPADIGMLERAVARQWAAAAADGGFSGILYRLREDPKRRPGLALFDEAGEQSVPGTPPAQWLPVGLRNELVDLFDGEYRGDPILK